MNCDLYWELNRKAKREEGRLQTNLRTIDFKKKDIIVLMEHLNYVCVSIPVSEIQQ